MPKISAGLLMYRKRKAKLEVLLVHPGGPFWRNKDDGVWSIPKGEAADGEDLLDAAKREFEEETGHPATGRFIPLPPVKLKSAKTIYAWAVAGDLDPGAIRSNTFTMEWPPNSAKQTQFPEIDRAEFFDLETAGRKIHAPQAAFLVELQNVLRDDE